jgi:hypothetical protein
MFLHQIMSDLLKELPIMLLLLCVCTKPQVVTAIGCYSNLPYCSSVLFLEQLPYSLKYVSLYSNFMQF